MLNGNSMSFGKRFGWLAAILLAGAGCTAQVGGSESLGEDQAALAAAAPLAPAALNAPQTQVQIPGLNVPKPAAAHAPVDPGASELGGENSEPQPNPWHGGSSADEGDDREPQPNPWLGRRGGEDGEPQPNPWGPVVMPGPAP